MDCLGYSGSDYSCQVPYLPSPGKGRNLKTHEYRCETLESILAQLVREIECRRRRDPRCCPWLPRVYESGHVCLFVRYTLEEDPGADTVNVRIPIGSHDSLASPHSGHTQIWRLAYQRATRLR
jgi:hypothetical protein